MLRYNYSLSVSSNSQEIVLDDFYVSPDLSYISGTTENIRVCSVGDSLWVRSPYFPRDLQIKVTSSELVKRNGYVLVPKTLQVHKAKVYSYGNMQADVGNEESSGSTPTVISYLEYNGNTYFSDINDGHFVVDGEEYWPINSFLAIKEKVYIRNDKLTVDGVTFNTTINNSSELSLTDSTDNMYLIPESWDCTHVDSGSTWLSEIVIGENIKKSINCRHVGYYGHMPYIIYNGEKLYLEYFYDTDNKITGAGVKINGTEYQCDALYILYDYDWEIGFNLYNINDYYKDDNGNAVMSIDDKDYIIYFEAGSIPNSGIIGIETVEEHLPILKDDRITIHSIESSNEVIVRYDQQGQGYIYLNGRRYDVVKNLCDSVVLGGIEHELFCDWDCENPESGNTMSCQFSDGTVMNFKVVSIDTATNRVEAIKKVENVNGTWVDLYSMIEMPDGAVTYSSSTNYQIVHYDGIRIGDYNAKVLHYKNVFHEGEASETVEEYDYIELGSRLEYRLKVINTVGSNMFLCIPDVDITVYDGLSMEDVSNEILYSIQGNNFVIEKRSNAFGVIDLYYDTWMSAAVQNIDATSVYDLAGVYSNIRLIQKTSHFTLPVGLYKNITKNIEYEDLITNQYYSEEAEKAINKLVDMEKDMYSPVIKWTGLGGGFTGIESIEFNLHFRTRDLETWKIIEDEGVYENSSGDTQELSANYEYCNWFITDYYPFRHLIDNDLNNGVNIDVFEVSDLLGLMYFTTNDVEVKREKLRKSFLRLTFFDSKNPEKQNMLGTSTLYFDCDSYLNILNRRHSGIHFEPVAKSTIVDRVSDAYLPGDAIVDRMSNEENMPNVLTEAFKIPITGDTQSTDLCMGDYQPTLNSKIIVRDRYTGNNSSEGFYTYILKAFANKKSPQTIYMKAEFFHAGVGIKIPMVIATDENKEAISTWNREKLDNFKKGYQLTSVFDRLYVPITIEYSTELRKFVYHISGDGNYDNAILNRTNNKWVFNLFELKVRNE